MNNETTSTTINSISTTTTEPPPTTSERDPWSFVHAQELPNLSGPYSANVALVFFIFLTITSLLACIYISTRQTNRTCTARKSPISTCCSCTCRLLFFSFLIAGFSVWSVYSAQQSTWFSNNTLYMYTHFGPVRIVDTNTSFHNGSVTALEETNHNHHQEDYFDAQVIVAQAQVVFGGEWACGNENSDIVCKATTLMRDCFQIVCDDAISTCTQEEQQAANESATSCLVNVTGDYDMPINVTSLNFSVPPMEYPNAPLIGMYSDYISFAYVILSRTLTHTHYMFTLTEGYWNCDTCAFIDVEGYEAAQEVPSDTLRMTGIGFLCGAGLVIVLWVVTKIGVWLLCPDEMYFEPDDDDDSDWEEQVDDWIVAEQHPRRVRTRRYFERQFARSKQWMQGSPLPRVYFPESRDFGDKLDEYYGNRRDGLEMINRNRMDDDNVEEDEIPEYWRQWNEEKQAKSLPS